jgi:adenosylhomocysteine nucleosidase
VSGGRAAPEVLILAAMPEELGPLRARLRADPRVALAVTGDGERNALAGAARAIAETGARSLLAVGVAGALSAELRAGDLLVARRVARERGGVHEADPRLVEAAARAARAWTGVVVSAARLADSAAEKRRLLHATGADGAAVADLESAAYAAAAEAAGIPWLVLRAVSDTADEALPALLNRCLDDGGAVRRARVLGALLTEPWTAPRLLQLRRRVHACAESLAEGAAALLSAPLPLAGEAGAAGAG